MHLGYLVDELVKVKKVEILQMMGSLLREQELLKDKSGLNQVNQLVRKVLFQLG